MQKKDDKVGNKTAYKKKGKGKKKWATKKFKIDSQKKVQILAYAHARKTKKLQNYIQLAEN